MLVEKEQDHESAVCASEQTQTWLRSLNPHTLLRIPSVINRRAAFPNSHFMATSESVASQAEANLLQDPSPIPSIFSRSLTRYQYVLDREVESPLQDKLSCLLKISNSTTLFREHVRDRKLQIPHQGGWDIRTKFLSQCTHVEFEIPCAGLNTWKTRQLFFFFF